MAYMSNPRTLNPVRILTHDEVLARLSPAVNALRQALREGFDPATDLPARRRRCTVGRCTSCRRRCRASAA